jgi:hypothetical protein
LVSASFPARLRFDGVRPLNFLAGPIERATDWLARADGKFVHAAQVDSESTHLDGAGAEGVTLGWLAASASTTVAAYAQSPGTAHMLDLPSEAGENKRVHAVAFLRA